MIRLIAMLGMVGIVGAQDLSTTSERHTGRRAVIVDVLVRNKTGPVTGLMKDDFTLQDKGRPQQIEIFAAVDARDASAKPAPPSPLIGYNKVTRRGEPVKAATVILYDRLNTPPADQAYVRKQVLAALKALKDTDIFAFYSLGRSLTPVHDFTEDPTTLIHAATRLSSEPPQPPPDDRAEQTMQKALDEALQTQQNIDMLFRVATTARAFQSITRHLSGLQGRKSVAWVTRTFPLTFGANVDRRGELDKELNAATITLQEENIALYPINPAGVGKGYTGHHHLQHGSGPGRPSPGGSECVDRSNRGHALGQLDLGRYRTRDRRRCLLQHQRDHLEAARSPRRRGTHLHVGILSGQQAARRKVSRFRDQGEGFGHYPSIS